MKSLKQKSKEIEEVCTAFRKVQIKGSRKIAKIKEQLKKANKDFEVEKEDCLIKECEKRKLNVKSIKKILSEN
jgi:hypothetical protein